MRRVCYSGGAEGADLEWGRVAKHHGYDVVHFSFPGHRTRAERGELVVLGDEQLRRANARLAIASRSLKRSWPPRHAYTRKLLQRNHWQVRETEAVYAISHLLGGQVTGGTAWAVQLYVDSLPPGRHRCYVFCQTARAWFYWNEGWHPIERPPCPPAAFTGIGSRALTADGRRAIHEVFS